MTKFSLIPNPTFSATASIPRAGAEGKKAAIEPQADYLMEIAEGWALPDEFTRENVIVLLKNYPRAFDSIGLAYTKELMGFREKN